MEVTGLGDIHARLSQLAFYSVVLDKLGNGLESDHLPHIDEAAHGSGVEPKFGR